MGINLIIIFLLESLVILYGVINLGNLRATQKWVAFLIVCALASDLISYFRAEQGLYSAPVTNLYSIIEVVLFFLIYRRWLKRWSSLHLIVCVAFSLVMTIQYIRDPYFESGVTMGAWLIYMAIASIICLLDQVNNSDKRLERNSAFWIQSAFLIYSMGSLFITLLYSYFVRLEMKSADYIWLIHNVYYAIFLAAILYSIYIPSKKNYPSY